MYNPHRAFIPAIYSIYWSETKRTIYKFYSVVLIFRMSGSDLLDALLDRADLRFANVRDIDWKGIKSIKGANVFGIKNAPAGFSVWAKDHGAVEIENDQVAPDH